VVGKNINSGKDLEEAKDIADRAIAHKKNKSKKTKP
jgi:hypothetical protein